MMQAPGFWSRPREAPGAAARLLAPLSAVWAAAARRRIARPGIRPGVPVLCVGNLTVGGAGKTPTVMALLARLAARGVTAAVVSRGHGGSLPGPVQVDPRRHSAAEVGDEPLMLAALAPVFIGRDRAAAARAAVGAGAQAILLDDGFQNPALVKDLSLVVVDAGFGFGNGRVMPAGPLREPLAAGLARADLILAIGSGPERAALRAAWPELGALPMVEGALRPLATGMPWAGLRVLAFAGIGRPEKFFATLRALGAEVVATRAFCDHAPYPPQILARLLADAGRAGAQLVTTEKDAARLPREMVRQVLVLPVRLDVADWASLDARLAALGLGSDRAA